MVVKRIFFIFTAIYLAVFISYAQDPGKKLHKGGALLIEAYTQRILPGRRESRIIKETHFIVIWQNKNYPGSFNWLDGDDTLICNIRKAHKINSNSKRRLSGRPGYYSENTAPDKIQKGDTLDISHSNAGSALLPSGMPKNRRNMLVYTIGDGKTLYGLRVDSITKKQDTAMP
jgi:hypothetical protein